MGFMQPSPPPFDLEEWKAQPFLTRLKANAQDWAVNGFGTPGVVYLLYIVKLALYLVGAFLVIGWTTPEFGGLGDFSDWWSSPIVLQKFAVWTLVWEILGLGSGSMPLALRFSPLIGGVLYWLRPGRQEWDLVAQPEQRHQAEQRGDPARVQPDPPGVAG